MMLLPRPYVLDLRPRGSVPIRMLSNLSGLLLVEEYQMLVRHLRYAEDSHICRIPMDFLEITYIASKSYLQTQASLMQV